MYRLSIQALTHANTHIYIYMAGQADFKRQQFTNQNLIDIKYVAFLILAAEQSPADSGAVVGRRGT